MGRETYKIPRILAAFFTAHKVHRDKLTGILRYAHLHEPWVVQGLIAVHPTQEVRRDGRHRSPAPPLPPKPLNMRKGINVFVCFFVLLLMPVSARAERNEVMAYDVSWLGMVVGGMTVQERRGNDGTTNRSIRVRSRPWVATLFHVDDTVRCVINPTDNGPRHTVSKAVDEGGFVQNDTLMLWPSTGVCVWSNAVTKSCSTSSVPTNTQDVVSFFFDLRDTLLRQTASTNVNYQLIMDGAAHALDIKRGETRKISTAFGKAEVVAVKAVSKSPTLFSRNKPKDIWVAKSRPVVLAVDVGIALGTVHVALRSWTIDGASADPTKTEKNTTLRQDLPE